MAMGCGLKLCKGLAVVFNFVFLLVGAGMLALGGYTYHQQEIGASSNVFDQFLPWGGIALSIAVMAVGGLVFLMAFFGCCGAARESKCLLGFYIFFMVVVGIGAIATGAAVATNFGPFVTGLDEFWKTDLTNAERTTWQTNLHCCGFLDNTAGPPETANGCQLDNPPASPCGPIIKAKIATIIHPLTITAISVGAFMFLSIVAAGCMCCAIPSASEERQRLLDQARYANTYTNPQAAHHDRHVNQRYQQ